MPTVANSVADPDPGSGIRDPELGTFLTPWIRDPGSGIRDGRKSASGSGIRDPGWKKVGSGIRDPDPG